MRIAIFVLALAVSAPALAGERAQPAKPADGKEKLICRRDVPIGSLIATRKTCLTALQWQKQAEDAEAAAERMNPHISTEHGR